MAGETKGEGIYRMKNQVETGTVLHVQAGETRLSVEITPDTAFFERETGSVFQIGEGGRYTVVFGEEFEVFHDLNKPFFGLHCTENGETTERLRIESDWLKEVFVDSVFPVAGQALALIPVNHFAQVYPEVKSGQAGTPPWAKDAEDKPAVLPADDGDAMDAYIVMKSEIDRLPGGRHKIERLHIEMAEKMGAELVIVKELALLRGAEPYYFQYRTEDLLREMGDAECVFVAIDGHLVG